jgi:glycosyltransferase involved in cell wall biosynthesis
VSENTKKDLIRLYNVPKNKIEVVYEGISDNPNSTRLPRRLEDEAPRNDADKPYLLFIGRLEKRKNIEGIVEAYEILKEKYNIAHKLVLVGKPGFGFSRDAMSRVLRKNIIFTGFVSEKEKYNLLQNADVFLFPTFYEGFGLPVLEAQSAGVPAVTSNISSLPEVGGDGVMYCDPHDPKSIADAVYKVISNQGLKDDIIKKGYENVLRFSWSKCAEQIKKIVD